MKNNLTTRDQYRLAYCDLHHKSGTARTNVLADVSLTGLAPVLRNPLAMFFFNQYVARQVAALNLRKPEDFRARPLAIRLLKQMRGVYCVEMPQGFLARLKFVNGFIQQLR